MSQPTYFLYSKLPGDPNVGVWIITAQKEQEQAGGQAAIFRVPVRLDADLLEWSASQDIVSGGPTYLGVGPFKYTGELEGEVFAATDEGFSREWFITHEYDQYYRISIDHIGRYVWTAGKKGEPITIQPAKPVAEADDQLFKFVPLRRE